MTGYSGSSVVGSTNIGFGIVRGVCSGPRDIESCVVTDRSRSVVGNFRDGDVFEMDDDLETARLKVTRDGTTHQVVWRARTDPAPIVRDPECGLIPAGIAVGFGREANASGSLFGTKVRSRFFTFLETTAYSC